jgi:type III pantothenate kinase
MILVIDAGNTRTKWGIFSETGTIQSKGVINNNDLSNDVFAPWVNCEKAILGCVASSLIQSQLENRLRSLGYTVNNMKSQDSYQALINQYEPPQSLGIDRFASVVAAWKRYTEKSNCLVVNAGTTLTIDTVMNNQYVGGVICPGLGMSSAALQTNTAIVNPVGGVWIDLPKNTADASYSGILVSMVGAVMIQYQKLKEVSAVSPKIILTGGDAPMISPLMTSLELVHQVVNDLVLEGLFELAKE